MQARVKAQSTSGQTWLSALRTPKKKKKSELVTEQRPQFPFKLENLFRGSK